MQPVKKICKECGSESVFYDAFACWSVEYQMWELHDFYDAAYCQDCDGQCTIIEKEAA